MRRRPNFTPEQALEFDTVHFGVLCSRSSGGCWIWMGDISKSGYARFTSYSLNKRMRGSRFSFFLRHGHEPVNSACHTCNTPACVNPDHIYDGDAKQNASDMVRSGRCNPNPLLGQDSHRAKLTNAEVLLIKDMILRGDKTRTISTKFGVTLGCIRAIKNGVNWTHLTGFGNLCNVYEVRK